MKKITINGKDYNVKYTIRALFIFEQITGKPFSVVTLMDNYLLFYCMILANNIDEPLEWDDFISAIDEDGSLVEQLISINNDYLKRDKILNPSDNGTDTEQKKS